MVLFSCGFQDHERPCYIKNEISAMKRHLLTIIFALFLPGFLQAQNAFYNAQFLATLDGDELRTGILEEDEAKAKLVHFTTAEKEEVENLIRFLEDPFEDRSEERRLGQECVSTVR